VHFEVARHTITVYMKSITREHEEYCLFDRALLQKRPMILRNLLIVATSCHVIVHFEVARHTYMKNITRENEEYRLFYRALLQKRPVILRSLLMVGTLT